MTERREDPYTREDRELRRYHNRERQFSDAPAGPEDAKRVGPSRPSGREELRREWLNVDRDPSDLPPPVVLQRDGEEVVFQEASDCTGECWYSIDPDSVIKCSESSVDGGVTYYLASCVECELAERGSTNEDEIDAFIRRHNRRTGHRVTTWRQTDGGSQ